MKFAFDIKGMHCKSCVMLVKEELEDNGATDVTVTLDAIHRRGTAAGEHDAPDALIPKIKALGEYDVRRTA